MPTRIERLEASLKKEKDRLDFRTLYNAEIRIGKVQIALQKHAFRPHRLETVDRLMVALTEARGYITSAQLLKADSPDDKEVT